MIMGLGASYFGCSVKHHYMKHQVMFKQQQRSLLLLPLPSATEPTGFLIVALLNIVSLVPLTQMKAVSTLQQLTMQSG